MPSFCITLPLPGFSLSWVAVTKGTPSSFIWASTARDASVTMPWPQNSLRRP